MGKGIEHETEHRMAQGKTRALSLVCLIIAGELIFSLPFHIPRYFRPSFLEVFGLSNANLGDIFASYGVIAMLAYFPGGLIADKFSARKLITASLIATALGGIYLASLPSPRAVAMLYAYWGLTSILLFWAALLRATREWGGSQTQGLAFGLLDGGRGLAAAIAASIAVFVFSSFISTDINYPAQALDETERKAAMQAVIYLYSGMTFIAAILCWFFVAENSVAAKQAHNTEAQNSSAADPVPGDSSESTRALSVLFNPLILMQAGIVVAAYCAYKGLDNYGLYAVEVLGMSELASSEFTAVGAYLRPVGAIAAGFFADRFTPSRVIGVMFAVLIGNYALGATLNASTTGVHLLIFNLGVSYLAVFALRGVYFALLEEISVVKKRTGTAIGIVSVIGFTPDIFFFSIAGRLLDNNPGVVGHHQYFSLLAGIAALGLVLSFYMVWTLRKGNIKQS